MAAAQGGFRLIDGFVPDHLREADPDHLSRGRIVAIACIVSATIHAGTCVAMVLQGLPIVAAGNLASALLCALLAWMFRRGLSMHIVSNGLLAVLLLFVGVVAGSTGGEANSALHTVTVVPGVAILLSGWRSGAVWLAIVCAFAVVLGLLRAGGFEFPVELDPEKVALSKYPGVIALTLGISTVIFLSEWVKRQALRDLAEARRVSEDAERERRHLEAAMLESQRLESLGGMAGGIAHDFNNLLTAIVGNASLMPTESPSEEAVLAEEIVLAGEQAGDLTDQLLAYAGRSRSVRGPVSLSDVVRDVDALAHAARGPDVDLRFELATEPTTVVADPGQIRQVVLNLLTNACSAIAAGGKVVIRTGTDGLDAFAEVEDDGSGMEPEVRVRMFDPFFTTKPTGRGLGLSAVLGIVRSHGGHVRVESEPGQGTRIRVLLPKVDLVPEDASLARSERQAMTAFGGALVVDDVEAVRRFASRTLRRMGFEVFKARNGNEALHALEAEADLRLVLLDSTMPGLRGDEVLEEIGKRRPRLPVILSTGDPQGFAAVDPEAPGTFWLPKPYQAAALKEAAARALSMAEGAA